MLLEPAGVNLEALEMAHQIEISYPLELAELLAIQFCHTVGWLVVSLLSLGSGVVATLVRSAIHKVPTPQFGFSLLC